MAMFQEMEPTILGAHNPALTTIIVSFNDT
ncbi:hypothetical protein C7972_102146 [Arenibacter sp. ARW7G5Y1]|nr:hypothetical protein C7972_102146 [Arenibacter sp. ARW7G5Y1]